MATPIPVPDGNTDLREERSIEELDTAICQLAGRIHAQSYRLLLLVREFDDRLGWAQWSFRSCPEWLAWRCGLSLSAAREKVRTAQALRGLPEISAAFADGRLSYSKVRALTRAATIADEDLLLAYALRATAAQVEERCRQIRNIAPESVDVARRAWERRSLTVARNPEAGTLILSVELPVEDGEVIVQALDRAVEAGETALGVEFSSNSWQAQQADALVAIAKAYLVTDTQATSAGDAYQVVLHVDEAALRGGIGRSDLPLDTIKRLTCDGSVIRVTEDESGTPLDIGRKKRTVTTVLKRALLSRDRGCSFPGCHHKKFVDAHHIRHWAEGGDTSLDNLMLLCTYHHRLLHEGGYAIKRDQDGEVYFERRDGRVIPNCGYEFGSQLSSQSDDPCVRTSHSRSTSAS